MAITNANMEKDFHNKLLKRREITVSFEFEGKTPSREEIKKQLSDRLNLKQENVVIVKALQSYGEKKGSATFHEYQDKDAMKVAQKHIVARPNAKKAKGEAQKQQTATATVEEGAK